MASGQWPGYHGGMSALLSHVNVRCSLSCCLRKSTSINCIQAVAFLEDFMTSSSAVARGCPTTSLPTRQESGHCLEACLVMSCAPGLYLDLCVLANESHLPKQVYCGAMTRVLCLYGSTTSPAQPSPLCFFYLCIFLFMLHLPSFASWHLITKATAPGIRAA